MSGPDQKPWIAKIGSPPGVRSLAAHQPAKVAQDGSTPRGGVVATLKADRPLAGSGWTVKKPIAEGDSPWPDLLKNRISTGPSR